MKVYALIKVVCVILWIAGSVYPLLLRPGEFRVSVLDVGQGDSIFVQCPNGVTILVDGGPGAAVLGELGEAMMPWNREIDILLLTHDHDDHLAGFFDVLNRYRVNEIWVRENACESKACIQMIEFANRSGVVVVDMDDAVSAVKLNLGGVGLSLFFFDFDFRGDSVNNSSIICVFTYGEFSLALMGDLEDDGENRLVEALKKQNVRNISVLKAGHHCSKTASSELFLLYTQPAYAFCSVGKDNRFGHPHKETTTRFQELGIEYLRTDEKGRIVLKTNGVTWRIYTEP